MPKKWLHIEGLAVLLISIYFYAVNDFSWLLYFLLLFAPDLSMLGYLHDKRIGAVIYNLFHTYVIPIIVIILGAFMTSPILISCGLIWTGHIGMDRMLGFGLKYHTDFKDTHLQRM